MSENFTSIKTFRDFLSDKQNPIVMVTLLLSGKSFLEKATFRIELRQHTNAHDEFCIVVPDTSVDSFEGYVLQNSKNLLGQKLTVSFHRYGVVVQSFTGIVSKIINKKNKGGGYGDLHIIGHAPSILLENGKDCQSFQDKTLPEIIAEATSEYGNDVEIKVEGGINHKHTLPYTVQYKESDYQFISRLARRYGEFFYYNGTHLIFGNQAQNTVEVEEGSELIDVEFELLIKPQKFTYVSYDIEKGELQERPSYLETTQNKENPFAQVAKNASEKVYQKIPEMYFSGISQSDVNGELEAVVRREKESREHLMQVRGRSREPQLRIGGFIKLRDINNKAMETYRIIDIKHYQSGYEYYNEFVAIPDVFVAYYFDENAYARSDQQPAQVVDNNDPEGLGRVRVQFLWQQRKGEKTPWIRVAQPHAGAGKGFYFIPEIGEEVLVDFEDQNAERPFVLGSYYNGKQKSNYHTAGNDKKVIHTRSGTKIILNDAEGSVFIEDPSGNTYLMDGQGNINVNAPKNITFTAGENLNINVGQNMITSVGNDMTTNVVNDKISSIGGNHQLDVEKEHQFSSKNYTQKVQGDKTINISGALNETTSETVHSAKDGDVTIKSAGVSKLLGKVDAKVNKG
ncbi:type VI secretion system Vgr family protein [Capnocytophaga canis]|uniref:type VI secretion system Vgr family protein n=1 Tax=Capnocytophaga canis TaxID=1848903 RepID=UPI0037CF802C